MASFEKHFDTTDELTAWVEFQARENGLNFDWNKVHLRAWHDYLTDQQALDLHNEEICC